jgi:hypothetical protein
MDTSTMVSPNMPKLAAYLFKQADTAADITNAMRSQADAYKGFRQSLGGDWLPRAYAGNLGNNVTGGILRPYAAPAAKATRGVTDAIFGNPATVNQEKGIVGGVHRFWNNNRLGRALSEGRGGISLRMIPDTVANSMQMVADAPLVQRYLDSRDELHGVSPYSAAPLTSGLAGFVYPSDPAGVGIGGKIGHAVGAVGSKVIGPIASQVGPIAEKVLGPKISRLAALGYGKGMHVAGKISDMLLPTHDYSTAAVTAPFKEAWKHKLTPGYISGTTVAAPGTVAVGADLTKHGLNQLTGQTNSPSTIGSKLKEGINKLNDINTSAVDSLRPGYDLAANMPLKFNPFRQEDRSELDKVLDEKGDVILKQLNPLGANAGYSDVAMDSLQQEGKLHDALRQFTTPESYQPMAGLRAQQEIEQWHKVRPSLVGQRLTGGINPTPPLKPLTNTGTRL